MWHEIVQSSQIGLLYLSSAVLLLIGLVGCVLPYPGLFVTLGGCITYAFAKGEPYPAWWIWVLLSFLAIFGTIVDNITTAIGAKKYGGGQAAFWFSLVGLIIGSVAFFPLGMIAGPFLGAFLAEWLVRQQAPRKAALAGLGALLGLLSGVGCKIFITLVMVLVIAFY